MRVYFDASVIISAFLSSTGASAQLIWLVKKGILKGITSQTVIDEILAEDKESRLKKSTDEIQEYISQSFIIVRERILLREIGKYMGQIDVEDAHLIAGANLTHCEYLISLDKKHVLRKDIKEKFLPLKILSPKELLEELINK